MRHFIKKVREVVKMSREVLLRFPVDIPEELKGESILRKGKEVIVLELLRKKTYPKVKLLSF